MELCAVVKTSQVCIPGPFPEFPGPTGKAVPLLQANADIWLCLSSAFYSERASFPNLCEGTVWFSTSPPNVSCLVQPRLCAALGEITQEFQW